MQIGELSVRLQSIISCINVRNRGLLPDRRDTASGLVSGEEKPTFRKSQRHWPEEGAFKLSEQTPLCLLIFCICKTIHHI